MAIALSLGLMQLACSPVDDPSVQPPFNPATAQAPIKKDVVAANSERNLLWGDLHIHTSLSTDGFKTGTRALPEQAYIFAKGGEIEHAMGYGIKIHRPLDFAAVTDHAEYLGVLRHQNPDSPIKKKSLRQRMLEDGPLQNTLMFIKTMRGYTVNVEGGGDIDKVSSKAWQQVIDTAERHNDPGRFTTFIGYEWTSMPDSKNLHRNIIFRNSQVPQAPFSALDSEDPRELWQWLDGMREQGIDSLAIPHNGNASGGRMYDSVAFDGDKLDAAYADLRNRNEPVSEIFQGKGASETHPELSPDDEFAGFELYDQLLATRTIKSEPKGSYSRWALRTGLSFQHNEGFNPFEFGVIGSSDSHTASTPHEEFNYNGKLPVVDGTAGLRLGKSVLLPDEFLVGKKWSSAGLAAVWAEENTRESIFNAIRRRETYATSGPRILLRFFGGWAYPSDLLEREDRVSIADKSGVPMGGVLPAVQGKGAPQFAVWAMKDSLSGNLDRIQIIKAWVDAGGEPHEAIYNVALSDGRQPDAVTGKVPAVGNTVDIEKATYTNTIGDTQLAALWQDPDFDSTLNAVYYARVIEIPTPRWSTYDAALLQVEAPEPATIQERAVSSAIWYQPAQQ
ncbi:DUF3604 domain-containing protein [Spongiibacter sp. KMU-158]|uniref:DUF3604 domain-containing protein n=2 Tax=Spongiibacter pelagi TaxID=2760804 RepID=A0A927C1S9_9GAMM|nr:DUF3604 domain-containing protein [Spongiibacter pelagi]